MKEANIIHSPSPDKYRSDWKSLNGIWEFSFDKPIYDKEINVPFSWACPLSGIDEPDKKGTGYYRKYEDYIKTKDRLFIVFEGVDYECEVRVNGVYVGFHIGGYSCFEFDITDVWKNGETNEICVKATDNDLSHQMYGKQGYGNSRGIWQDVYLQERPQSYIDKFTISTEIDGMITFDIKTCGEFDKISVETEIGIFDSKSNHFSFKIDNPVLWDTENPYLYDCKIMLYNGTEIDEVNTYFGIREVGYDDFDGKKYITLNKKPLFVLGALDQSFHPDGFYTFPNTDYAKDEIIRAKRLGLNCLRIHIKTEDRRKLYWADKLGVLIMEDIPCFWGEPTQIAREYFEKQMYEIVDRDINHPSVFYWVIFNETWGLKSKIGENETEYKNETQEWVRRLYHDLKEYDSTRLVEDNSPCHKDHVETDVNSWHFYRNGYETVKTECERVSKKFIVGSSENYIGENRMTDVPVINSECGNYWNIEGSAGDSDFSWHYKYMMNEFRLHEKIGGFIFTEFKDVPNEFNGLYRIDDTPKFFGYENYIKDMSINDLHSMDYIGFDFPPMVSINASEIVSFPLFISSMSDKYHGTDMKICWEAELKKSDGTSVIYDKGTRQISYSNYGTTMFDKLNLTMPNMDGIVVVKLYLKDTCENIVMRNFLLFDVIKNDEHIGIDVLKTEGFLKTWYVQNKNKLNCIGNGSVLFELDKANLPVGENGTEVIFEASSRRIMKREINDENYDLSRTDLEYIRGYKVDRGENPNSFYMTGPQKHSSKIMIFANEIKISEIKLEDCPADSTGCLSWLYQNDDKCLDEAGSYGYIVKIHIDKQLIDRLPQIFNIRIEAEDGISIFGRKSGAYPIGISLREA